MSGTGGVQDPPRAIDATAAGTLVGEASAGVRIRASSLLLAATWFALLTGLAELGIWTLARYVLHRAVHFDPQLVWTSPAANFVVFILIGLLLLGVYRRRGTPWFLASSIFATITYCTVLLMVPRLHGIALVVLSIGAGVQTARMLTPRLAGFERVARRMAPVMLAAILLMAGAVNGAAFWREWQRERVLPAPAASLPNVLFIIWDTVRAASMGLYGYERNNTPVLGELASRSVVFEHAITPAPWTLAAHGSFLTGRMPFELSASWTVPLDDRYPTLAEVLAARGYESAAFVANYIYGPPAYGLGRGFTRYRYYPLTAGTVLTSSALVQQMVRLGNRVLRTYWVPGRRSAPDVTNAFLDWQSNTRRPFFAFLNYFDAHDPYAPEPPFDRRFGNPRVRRTGSGRLPSPEVRRDLIDAYDGAIASLDDQLGGLLAEMRQRGLLENTLIVISSDHGELFGEHELFGHGNSLYFNELHVPLIVSMPGRVPAGKRVEGVVSLRDLPATIMDVIGVPDNTFPGSSLARHWRADSTLHELVVSVVPFSPRQPDRFPISKGDMRSLIDWPYQLIVRGDGAEQLFDLSTSDGEYEAVHVAGERLASLRAWIARVPAQVTRAPTH